jgi:UDP-glucose 6-dehydrogenase
MEDKETLLTETVESTEEKSAAETEEVKATDELETPQPEPIVKRTIGFFGDTALHSLCTVLAEKLPDAWEPVLVADGKKNKAKKKALNSDIVFISGEFCADVEDLVSSIRNAREDSIIIIRGDVALGTTAKLEGMFGNVMYNPDNASPLLTEEEKLSQLKSEGFQLIGLIEADRNKLSYVIDLFTALNFHELWASKNIAFVGSTVAELTRVATMTYLTMKDQFFGELNALAGALNLDSQLIKNVVATNAGIGNAEINVDTYKPTLHAVFKAVNDAAKDNNLELKLHQAVHTNLKCED